MGTYQTTQEPSDPGRDSFYEIFHTGIYCRVMARAEPSKLTFELQTLEGELLGTYILITDALEEADAYDYTQDKGGKHD